MTCPDYYKSVYGQAKDLIKPFIRFRGPLEAWYLGNALKYLFRYDNKDSESAVKDLKKAKDYIDFIINDIYGDTKDES